MYTRILYGVFSLLYCRHKPNLCCPLEAEPAEEGFPLYAPASLSIQSGSQVLVDTHISFNLSTKTLLKIYLPEEKDNTEPHMCPEIIDLAHKSYVQVLLANLTDNIMLILK